ncbi:TrkH family potassium uptake protein [Planctomycetota bacterium]
MRNRFQTFHAVLHFIGSLFIILGFLLLFPLALVFIYAEFTTGLDTIFAFLVPIASSFTLGFLLKISFKKHNLNSLQAMIVCSLAWLCFSGIGAIPFVIGIDSTFLDGFFETMSGFTTTGITMFTGLDSMPKSILFWRSLTQWIGGLGILTFFLALTLHGASAHRLFSAESHKIDMPRPVPGMLNTVKILWTIYGSFTLFIIILLSIAGMPVFDSICHSFTALSTGGFSPHDASISYYKLEGFAAYRIIEYILILGMIMGGMNFLIHYRIIKGKWLSLVDNTEMRYWWTLIALFTIIILAEIWMASGFTNQGPAPTSLFAQIEMQFRKVLFQVISILTTTGFATQDIGSAFFGHAARQLFLIMMVIGGCIGSTGGGIKVLRIAILFRIIKNQVQRFVLPSRSVSTILIDGKPLDQNEALRISGLFFAWIVLLVAGGTITALFSNLDSYSSFSGMFSALGNIGPSYISVKEMGALSPIIKIVYILGMLAGRLEIIPLLILFTPRAWK